MILVDANLLVYAQSRSFPQHEPARAVNGVTRRLADTGLARSFWWSSTSV